MTAGTGATRAGRKAAAPIAFSSVKRVSDMPNLPAISTEKKGSRSFLHVDLEDGAEPRFPRQCPCCLAAVEPGAFIVIARKELAPVRFPACAACARHARIVDRVTAASGWLSGAGAVATVLGFLFTRGADWVGSKGGETGWQVVGGLAVIARTFMNPVSAAITLFALGVVWVIYALILGSGLLLPLRLVFGKRACAFLDELGASRGYVEGKHYQRFTFEHRAYGDLFAAANGAAPKR